MSDSDAGEGQQAHEGPLLGTPKASLVQNHAYDSRPTKNIQAELEAKKEADNKELREVPAGGGNLFGRIMGSGRSGPDRRRGLLRDRGDRAQGRERQF